MEENKTLRVRILKAIDAKIGRFEPGKVIVLPYDIGRSLVGFGLAEEDKMLEIIPETKSIDIVPVKKFADGGLHHHIGPNVTLEVFQGTAKHPVPPPGMPSPKAKPKAASKRK